jgi:hypothetical protein
MTDERQEFINDDLRAEEDEPLSAIDLFVALITHAIAYHDGRLTMMRFNDHWLIGFGILAADDPRLSEGTFPEAAQVALEADGYVVEEEEEEERKVFH